MVKVGTACMVVLLVTIATHASVHSFGPSSNENSLNGCDNEMKNKKRRLQDALDGMFEDQTEARLEEDHDQWHSRHDGMGSMNHSHESKHIHNHDHDHENDDDNDDDNSDDKKSDDDEHDSDDNKNDDDKHDSDDNKHDDDEHDSDDDKKSDDDEHDSDDDKNDDEDDDSNGNRDSSKHNATDSGQGSQSSVMTKMNDINIGNTITIINIGTASQQPTVADNKEPSDSEPTGNALSFNDTDHGDVISAAAQVLCDSVACKSTQGSLNTDTNSSSMSLPPTSSVAGSNATGDSDVRYDLPAATTNVSSRLMPKWLAKWLLLVAVVIEVRRF